MGEIKLANMDQKQMMARCYYSFKGKEHARKYARLVNNYYDVHFHYRMKKILKNNEKANINRYKSSYELIANEYYESYHKTSRNFDEATFAFFKRIGPDLNIPANGFVLDLGAGKGRTIQYCEIDSSRIIQIDIAKKMLALPNREPCLQKIIGDALKLPFSQFSFSLVTSFLFDPFNIQNDLENLNLFKEIFYVLEPGGVFIGTMPHFVWGATLRRIRNQDMNETTFLLLDGKRFARTSILMDEEEISRSLEKAGFCLIKMHDIMLPKEIPIEYISHDILDPAKDIGQNVYCMPIIKFILAKKL